MDQPLANRYEAINDEEAMEGFKIMTLKEGIIPALETSHAIAYAVKVRRQQQRNG